MTEIDLARAAVRRGAAFLDEREPGWRSSIDLDTLDVSEVDDCVLGQMFGYYPTGLKHLSINGDEARSYGFEFSAESDIDGDPVITITYDELTAAWKELLSA